MEGKIRWVCSEPKWECLSLKLWWIPLIATWDILKTEEKGVSMSTYTILAFICLPFSLPPVLTWHLHTHMSAHFPCWTPCSLIPRLSPGMTWHMWDCAPAALNPVFPLHEDGRNGGLEGETGRERRGDLQLSICTRELSGSHAADRNSGNLLGNSSQLLVSGEMLGFCAYAHKNYAYRHSHLLNSTSNTPPSLGAVIKPKTLQSSLATQSPLLLWHHLHPVFTAAAPEAKTAHSSHCSLPLRCVCNWLRCVYVWGPCLMYMEVCLLAWRQMDLHAMFYMPFKIRCGSPAKVQHVQILFVFFRNTSSFHNPSPPKLFFFFLA